jgi:hypothetical protein
MGRCQAPDGVAGSLVPRLGYDAFDSLAARPQPRCARGAARAWIVGDGGRGGDTQDLGSVTELDSVLTTRELARRPARSPNLRAENGALRDLAGQMAEGPERLLEALAQMALPLCDAGTGGLSLVETAPDGTQAFR